MYAEQGVDASLEEIARRAGVGIGTLYRHFPTRDALNEAVYRREVEALCDGVARAAARAPAGRRAGCAGCGRFAAYVAKKRGMAMALKSALGPDNELFSYSHRRIREAIETLVDERAATRRPSAADVDAEDLLRAMSGICMAADAPGWSSAGGGLVDLLVDGLRYGASPS